jgi:predicted nucleic acid-binding Zn ribbon protein
MLSLITCVCCQRPIENLPGHRPRQYCSDTCRKKASRRRRTATELALLHRQWQALPEAATATLEAIEHRYGEDAARLATHAIMTCCADMPRAIQVAQALRHLRQS